MTAAQLNAALFPAESLAHLRGYERAILPLADAARTLLAQRDAQVDALQACDSAFNSGTRDQCKRAHALVRAALAAINT